MTPEKLNPFLESDLSVSWKVRRVVLCPRGDEQPGLVEFNHSDAPNDQHRSPKQNSSILALRLTGPSLTCDSLDRWLH